MKNFFHTIYRSVILASLCLLLFPERAEAFDLDAYAPKSVLSEGKWVKISVDESGMHCIPAATLKSWGFSDPSKVRVYGYGGRMLPDILGADTYIDDLPPVGSVVTDKGLTFYAVGPVQIDMSEAGQLSHSVNPYSSYGFYYLTETTEAVPAIETGGTALSSTDGCATTAPRLLVHEQELTSIGNSGRMFVGEDFRNTRTQTFPFALERRVGGTTLTLKSSFVAAVLSTSATLKHMADDTELPFRSSDQLNRVSGESGAWGTQSVSTKTFSHEGDKIDITLTLTTTGTVRSAYLDYLTLSYTRSLGGSEEFLSASPQIASEGAGAAGTHVWDVTDPVNPYRLEVGAAGAWRNDRAGVRRYAVWSESDNMPAPRKVADIKNQNLHGDTAMPDMVIIAPDAYMDAANDLADLHHGYQADPLTVATVPLDRVLNEFGSGAFDPGAIRRYLKMLYDRGEAAGKPLSYALLIGKGTFDNRNLTAAGRSQLAPMPLWMSENSLNDSQSYSTDDYFGLLSDNDGTRPAAEKLDIAVGRIPATSRQEAATAVDKIRQYLYSMPSGAWRTRMTLLADDENQGQHMDQAERLISNLQSGRAGRHMLVDKIYCDAYVRANSTYPQAREELFGDFADGINIFAFIGHGSPTALGSKLIITPVDFRDRFHIRRLPFFYAATCSFLHWDSDITSKAEEMMFQADGGFIGCISALRPVFITNNGTLSAAFGLTLGETDEQGNPLSIGQIYMRAKNRVNNDSNKLRYVLMADPALRPVLPAARMTLDAINGIAVSSDEPFTAMARQKLTLTGRILNPDGTEMTDFNGTVSATLYDAEFSTTSHGYGEGRQVTFEQKGGMLFTAAGTATAGRFTVNVQMPAVIADNFRPATLNLFATESDKDDATRRHASAISRDLYAFGYDEDAEPDTEVPVIGSMTLNDSSFKPGGKVNTDPLLLAAVSDNTGINLSSAGVGQKMTLTIDERETFSDLSIYFTPDPVPTRGAMSGSLAYPLSGLEPGAHTLRLRVWDIAGNYADRTLDCRVVEGLAPEIYEVFTDAMPARTQARFYVRHNRPDQMVKVKVSVYSLQGTPLWSAETESRSNMETTLPLTWDLRDTTGRRVSRGIYVYRAEISSGGSTMTTKSKKMAVAAE